MMEKSQIDSVGDVTMKEAEIIVDGKTKLKVRGIVKTFQQTYGVD